MKHIHDISTLRSEKAAQRIIELEEDLKEQWAINNVRKLELHTYGRHRNSDIDTYQSELNFLKIQLKALEVQASRYIAREDDKELSEGIRSWKSDWMELDKQLKARRKRRKEDKGDGWMQSWF